MPGIDAFVAFSLTGPLLVIGVVAMAITAMAGGREPDPAGTRLRAVYLVTVSFVTIFVMVFSAFGVVSSLTDLIGEPSTTSSKNVPVNAVRIIDEESPLTGADIRDDHRTENAVSDAVQAGLFGLAAAAVFQFHRQRLQELGASAGFDASPARRTVQAYQYAVCFVAALVALAAAAAAAYGLYRIAAPTYSSPDGINERTAGARQLVASVVLTGIAGYVFFRFLPGGGPSSPTPPREDDLVPEPIDLEPAPEPRARRLRGSDSEGGSVA